MLAETGTPSAPVTPGPSITLTIQIDADVYRRLSGLARVADCDEKTLAQIAISRHVARYGLAVWPPVELPQPEGIADIANVDQPDIPSSRSLGAPAGVFLTARERQILGVIRAAVARGDRPPSVRGICRLVGLSSSCSVQKVLDRLRDKGFITRDPHEHRSIRLVM